MGDMAVEKLIVHISNKAMYFTQILVLLSTCHNGNEAVEGLESEDTERIADFFPAIYNHMVLLKVTTDASFYFLYLGIGQ